MLKTTFGQCLFESSSGLRVYQNAWYRWLTFGNNILQSVINRRHPENAGLKYIIPLTQMVLAFPGDCCLLGLGGAGVAHTLYPALSTSRVVAVDSCLEVINIARQYFMTSRILNLTTVHLQASTFVQSPSASYQHLIIDLHNGNDYPIECNNDAFFTDCKAMLNPEGILAINLINIKDKIQLLQRIRTIFNHYTLIVPIKGTTNTLIFAFNLLPSDLFLKRIEKMKWIKNLVWDTTCGLIGQLNFNLQSSLLVSK